MQPTIQDAIRAINPTLSFHISPDGVPSLTNLGGTLPSDEEIDVKLAELTAEYNSNQYSRKRKTEYPEIGDQLDMLWHAIDDGTLDKTSDFYTSLKATKDKYPKT